MDKNDNLFAYNAAGDTVILDERGMMQTWQEGRADNVDANNPLVVNIYLPQNTWSINESILSFKLLPFRAYSKGLTSGGENIVSTTSSGGGAYQATATSTSGGGAVKSTFSENYQSTFGHNHGVPNGTQLAVYPVSSGAYYTFVESGAHTHEVDFPDHSHDVEVSIPDHTHDFNVNIPPHSHDIEYGIYTSTSATGVGVIINGVDRTSYLGGKFNSDQANLNITDLLKVGQWNEIKLTSEQLGRIDASVFIQAFMGM